MTTTFRDTGLVQELKCPRCKKQTLPALDIAPCPKGCGTLVSAFAATEIFSGKELRVDAATRWWRRREPCPLCNEAMMLRGVDPGYFQGCEGHVFWVDADTIAHTSLAQGVDVAKLQAKHDSSAAVEQAQQLRVTAEAERQKIKHEKEEQEARLRRRPLDVSQPDDPGVLSTLELIAVTGGVGIVAAPILRSKFIQLANRNQELEARVAVLETALAEIRAALATREPH
jgi:hypothetical protein